MEKLRFKSKVAAGTISTAASLKAAATFFAHFGVEFVMLFTLSGALVYGPLYGFIIGAGIMVLADLMVGLVGLWTIYTAAAYGLVGFLAGVVGIFKKNFSRIELAGMSFILTILFDAITMTAFAFQFKIPFLIAATNQIPVTLLHVLGNTLLAFAFAPALMKIMNIISDKTVAEGLLGRIKAVRTYMVESLTNKGIKNER